MIKLTTNNNMKAFVVALQVHIYCMITLVLANQALVAFGRDLACYPTQPCCVIIGSLADF